MTGLQGLRDTLVNLREKVIQVETELGAARDALDGKLLAVQLLMHHDRRVPPATDQAPAAFPAIEVGQVNLAIQKLAQGTTQEQILEVFLLEAQTFAKRVILFLNKDTRYVPWKHLGFVAEDIESVTDGDFSDPIVRAAQQKQIIYRTKPPDQPFPWLEKSEVQPAYICIPFVFEDLVPLVLYGDSPESIAIDSLELLVHLTILVLKNNSLQALAAAKDTGPGEILFAAATETAEAGTSAEVAPEPGELRSDPQPTLEKKEEELTPTPKETLSAVGEENIEGTAATSEQTEKPAKVKLDAQETVAEQEDPGAGLSSPMVFASPEEQEKYHQEAQRFARLLISEIKLYEEEEVLNGCQARDLYKRLKEDVDRSRHIYQKRVHPTVASNVDYLHEEMVRLLAKGDETLFGSDYPGPQTRPRL